MLCLHALPGLVLLLLNVWRDPCLNMLARFGTLTSLKTFKCLWLFKSVLLGGQHMLNGTMIPIPGLKLLRPICKSFAGQALLTDVTIYVFHSCLILYIRGILYHLILIVPSRLLLI